MFFQCDVISRGIGCLEPNSVLQSNAMTLFLSDDGFYMCNGESIKGIGSERVDRFFFDDYNPSQLDKMSTAIDPIRKLVMWCYKNDVGNNSLLIYNWQLDKWSQAETTADRIAPAASSGVTLEGLDNYGTIDSIQISFDDRIWVGGQLLLAGTKGAKIVTFNGQPMDASITTGDIQVGARSMVSLARPVIDNGSASVSVASRTMLSDSLAFSTPVSADSEGRCSLRSSGKYHRVNVAPTGNWTIASAVDVDIVPQGVR